MFKNMQIYLFGMLFAMIGWRPSSHIWGWLPILIVFWNAATGLFVSFVLKYADNLCKGFSSGAATLLAALAMHAMYGDEIKGHFWVSLLIVCCSITIYYSEDNAVVKRSWSPHDVPASLPHCCDSEGLLCRPAEANPKCFWLGARSGSLSH